MLEVLLLDDDEQFLGILRQQTEQGLLEKGLSPQFHMATTAQQAEEQLREMQRLDLAWLDIDMGAEKTSGLRVAKALREEGVKLGRKVYAYFAAYEEIGHGTAWLPQDVRDILAVDIAPTGPEQNSDEHKVSIFAKDSRFPYHWGMTNELRQAAIDAGVIRCTHIFNAMSPLTHRAPGTVGAALNTEIYTELIADAFHVHPGIFPMMARLKERRLVLITDALRAAGMPDGEYDNGGQTFVLQGIECRLKDGTIAGSVLKMNQAVRNLRDYGKKIGRAHV